MGDVENSSVALCLLEAPLNTDSIRADSIDDITNNVKNCRIERKRNGVRFPVKFIQAAGFPDSSIEIAQ